MATLKTLLVRLGMDTKQFKSGVNRVLGGLDSMVARAQKLNGAAKAAGLAVLAGQAIQLTSALAPAAGAVLALPAAMIAVQASAATLKIGLAGMGDAMSAVADGDSKKLNESLKKLSPAAAAFVRQTAALKKSAFDPLRAAVQEKLFDRLTGPLKTASSAVLPAAKKGMTSLAGAMNGAAKEGLRVAATPMFRGELAKIFSGTSKTVTVLKGGIQPLVTIVMKLANAGMSLLQRMAGWAVAGAKSAAAFLTSKEGAAALAGVVQRAGDTLSALGRIAGNVGTFVGGLFKGARTDGAGLLTTIEQLTARMAAWSQSAQGQQQIGQVFALLGQTASALGPILGVLVGPLGAIAGLITSMPPGVQGTVSQLLAFTIVAGTIGAKLGPAVSGIRLLVGGIGKIPGAASKIGSAASAVGSFASKVVTGTAGAAAAAGRMALGVAAAAGRTVVSMATASASFLAAAGRMMVTMTLTAGRVVAGWVLMGVQSLAQAARVAAAWVIAMGPIGWIIAAVVALVALIVANWDTIKEAIGAAWEWVKEKTSAVWSAITGALSATWEGIKSAAAATWEWIKNAVKTAADFVVKIFMNFTLPGLIMKHWESIKSGAKAAWDWVVSKVEAAARGIVAGVSFLASLPGKVKAWFLDLVQGAMNKAAELLAWAQRFPPKILAGLGKLGSLLLSAGKDLVLGLINGIKAMAGRAIESVKGVVGDAIQGAKNLLGISSPSKVFQAIGKDTVAGLIKGLLESESSLKSTAQKLTKTVKAAFSGKMEDALVDMIRKGTGELKDLIGERERLLERLKAAYEMARNVASAAKDFAAVGNLGLQEGAGVSDVTAGLQGRLKSIKDFANNIKILAQRGLNKTILQQIIDAGVEKGAGLAEMMVGASGSELKALNKAQAAINKASKQLGKNAADGMYDAGKAAGKGFLTGITSQLKTLEAELRKIAKKMVAAIKSELKIKSPSRVMALLGGNTIAGLIKGMLGMQAKARAAMKVVVGKTIAAAEQAARPPEDFGGQPPAAPYVGNSSRSTGGGYHAGPPGDPREGLTILMPGAQVINDANVDRMGQVLYGRLRAGAK